MKEFLICESCNAKVELDSAVCEYCGSDFRVSKVNREILLMKEQIDRMFYTADFYEVVEKIESSKYKNHPIFIFRKAKALLVVYMTNDGILDSQEFCEVLKLVQDVSEVSADYMKEFILYLTVLFPSNHTKLFIDDLQSILAFLESQNLDREGVIKDKLIQQAIGNRGGDTFLREYQYYTNEKNFINNKDFIIKKEFLEKKYDELAKEIKEYL